MSGRGAFGGGSQSCLAGCPARSQSSIPEHWPTWPCPEKEAGWPGLSGLPLGRHSDKEHGNPAGRRGRCLQNFPKQVVSS